MTRVNLFKGTWENKYGIFNKRLLIKLRPKKNNFIREPNRHIQ